MIRDDGKGMILVACCLLATSAGYVASAQTIVKVDSEARHYRCANWNPATWDKKGVRRLLFPIPFGGNDETKQRAGRYMQKGRSLVGKFVASENVFISLISEPGGREPTLQFVTAAGKTIDFFADGSTAPVPVRNGRLADAETLEGLYVSTFHAIECAKSDSGSALEEPEKKEPAGKSLKSSKAEPSLADVFSARKTAPAGGGTEALPGELARSIGKSSLRSATETKLEDIFVGRKDDPGSGPPRKPQKLRDELSKSSEDVGSDPADRSKLTDVFGAPSLSNLPRPGYSKTETPPVDPETPNKKASGDSRGTAGKYPEAAILKDEGTSSRSVCAARTLRPLPVPDGVMLESMQTVGLRSSSRSASGFEYVDVRRDTIPLGTELDIADTVAKLIPYEAAAVTRRNDKDSLWVSIWGIDESLFKRKEPATKPTRTLRLIVVGGAAELAISGLDLVGTELKNQSGDPIRLDIEWYAVDETGSIKPPSQYSSLNTLVKDAAGKAAERLDVLNEPQILKLLDDFENLLKSQTRVVDKVFWIKGAYSLPGSIPQRLEKFIAAVSASSAVPHTPTGQVGKWLVIVTARMPGFSIAYLKEPIYSLQIGEVIEEGNAPVGAPRRLISETSLQATRLRLASTVAKPGGDAATDRGAALAGKLVLDAGEVFSERGYVLSPEAAPALQSYLHDVQSLWNESGVKPDILAKFEGRTRKSRPTLFDVLQLADEKAYLRLPKILPDWFRKPLKDLTANEARAANTFVAAYAAGADRLAEVLARSTTATGSNCSLFYVPEGYFGFDKLRQ
jgi:hypothetical protein